MQAQLHTARACGRAAVENDSLVDDVVDTLDAIVSPLRCYPQHLRHVLNAARAGTVADRPEQLHFYLLGAFHACACAEVFTLDTWEAIEAQLDRLLAGGGRA